MQHVLIMCSLLLAPSISMGGILGGPDNYDACIVERMKGMDKSVRFSVKKSCEREFEVILNSDQKELINVAWAASTPTEISIEIDKNESDFKVTKATLLFSVVECENIKNGDFPHRIDVDFNHWVPGKEPKTNAVIKFDNPHDYKCLQTKELYGLRYR